MPPSAAPTDATAAQAHRAAAAAPALQAASQIIRRFDGRTTSFDVRLDPVDLGRVDVRLEVGADRKVKANLAAEKQTTLAELVRAARDLERALNDAGLDVAENGVTFSLSGGGRDAPTPDGRANSGAGDERSASVGVDAGAATAPQRASLPLSLSRWSGARLDVWA
ncbi:MAG: flagellar hook-length control protein FliK [Alphaproteobacteria bacterium]|nr:flagellar hook-length control protein FliK [Alphaproteobacteria bacterium]